MLISNSLISLLSVLLISSLPFIPIMQPNFLELLSQIWKETSKFYYPISRCNNLLIAISIIILFICNNLLTLDILFIHHFISKVNDTLWPFYFYFLYYFFWTLIFNFPSKTEKFSNIIFKTLLMYLPQKLFYITIVYNKWNSPLYKSDALYNH